MTEQQCILNYDQCMSGEQYLLKTFVCQDKMRSCLGDVAHKQGNNNLWPYQNANYDNSPYHAVKDMDGSFRTPHQNSHFSIPLNHVTGGKVGISNRARPYQFLHGSCYGGLLKHTSPSSRDPIYH